MSLTASIPQVGIMLFGVSAVWLVGRKDPRVKRWGYVCGLCAQPFWAWAMIASEQYGILAMCVLYGYSWYSGLRNHWMASVTSPLPCSRASSGPHAQGRG